MKKKSKSRLNKEAKRRRIKGQMAIRKEASLIRPTLTRAMDMLSDLLVKRET